jgi:hypothetical protein
MNKIKSTIIALTLTVALASIVVGSIPVAYASSPGVTTVPSPVVIGGFPDVIISASVGAPHLDVRVGLREPPSTGLTLVAVVPTPSPPGGVCGLDRYGAGAGSYWILTTDGVSPITSGNMVEMDIPVGGSVSIPFRDAGGVTIDYSGGATGPATGIWVDDNTVAGKSPSIDFLATTFPVYDPYRVRVCGFDTAGGGNLPFEIAVDFESQKPVAGEILPINTTALLIAGFTSNPVWVLSALAVVAGGAFTILRLQINRKEI